MNNLSIIDHFEYSNKSWVLQVSDHILTPLRVVCGGRKITFSHGNKIIHERVYHSALRILAGIATLAICPLILLALSVKFVKGNQEKYFESEKSIQFDAILKAPQKELSKDRKEFTNSLKQELAKAKHLDTKLGPPAKGSWRAAFGEQEPQQLIDDYTEGYLNYTDWPDQRAIDVQRLGTFDEINLRIISITCDYLRVFHNLPVKINDNIMPMQELKEKILSDLNNHLEIAKANAQMPLVKYYKGQIEHANTCCPRKNGQYETNFLLNGIQKILNITQGKPRQILGLTNEDLYSQQLSNFVFGTAQFYGAGIFSNARFGDPTKNQQAFEIALLRMMKITAHEFGHMRGLPHCTDYECNIGGYMSLKELDERPLLFCMEDSAKVCQLTHIDLLEHHKRLYKFFDQFNLQYQLKCDFSKELSILKNRIVALSTK